MDIIIEASDIPAAAGVSVRVQPRGRPGLLLEPVEATSARSMTTWTLTCELQHRNGVDQP